MLLTKEIFKIHFKDRVGVGGWGKLVERESRGVVQAKEGAIAKLSLMAGRKFGRYCPSECNLCHAPLI